MCEGSAPASQKNHRKSQSFFPLRRSFTVFDRQNICLEIHLSPCSLVYGFCDIWIAAPHLQASEEYVNDFHSSFLSPSPLLLRLLSACCFRRTLTRYEAGAGICTLLRTFAIGVQKFTQLPKGYCAAADADCLFFLPLSWLPFFPSLPRCLHY